MRDWQEQASLYGYCVSCGALREVRRTIDTPNLTRLALVCSYDATHEQ